MRRGFAMLLLLALLAGCGAETQTKEEQNTELSPQPAGQAAEQPETEGQTETGVTERPQAPGEGLFLEMERAAYDPSVEFYTYFIRNGTEKETGTFGEPYAVQKLENGQWRDLEAANGVYFNSIGYHLSPGGVMALTCWMGAYTEERTPGQYRLVKEVGGQTLYAEFEIGESIYTAETPYGFGPLEELPENYGAPTAGELDVVFTHDGVQNDAAIEEFIYKSGLEAPCQLRTVQDYGEGAPLVTDVIYDCPTYGEGHFLWRQRQMGTGVIMMENAGENTIRSVTLAETGFITEKRFSYIVTDGVDLYLSNSPDWGSTLKYDSDKVLLIPEGSGQFLPAVEEQTASRILNNSTRYNIWSQDGTWSARLPQVDPLTPAWGSSTEFYIIWQKTGEGMKGGGYDLQDWDGLETAITTMEWQEGSILRLTCETLEGGASILYFDPETETLK